MTSPNFQRTLGDDERGNRHYSAHGSFDATLKGLDISDNRAISATVSVRFFRKEGEDPPGRRATVLLGLLVALAACTPACGANRHEFLCENAVAHLAACCPAFDPTSIECGIDRRFVFEDVIGFRPALSYCVLATDCQTIRDRGFCPWTWDKPLCP